MRDSLAGFRSGSRFDRCRRDISRMRSRSVVQQSLGTLAVLPFDNLSGDPQEDFFAAGITDEIITDVAKISKLNVISRTSVVRFKDKQNAAQAGCSRSWG